MTKYFELDWKIPVPKELQEGAEANRWVEEKENFDHEPGCKFKVDEDGFFVSWKSEGKVRKTVKCGLTLIPDFMFIRKGTAWRSRR